MPRVNPSFPRGAAWSAQESAEVMRGGVKEAPEAAARGVEGAAGETSGGEGDAFVPLSVARAKIASLVSEMRSMKARHMKVIDEISDNYERVVNEDRRAFDKSLREVKSRARARIGSQKERLAELAERDANSRKERQAALDELALMQTRLASAQEQHQNELKQIELQSALHGAERQAKAGSEAMEELIALNKSLQQRLGDVRQRAEENDAKMRAAERERDELLRSAFSTVLVNIAASAADSAEGERRLEAARLAADAEGARAVAEERDALRAQKAELEAGMRALPEIQARLRTLEQENADIGAEKERLQAYVNEVVATQQVGDSTEEVHQRRADELGQQLVGLKRERRELREKLNRLEEETAGDRDRREARRRELAALQEQLEAGQRDRSALQDKVLEAEERLRTSELAVSNGERRAAELAEEAAQLRAQLRLARSNRRRVATKAAAAAAGEAVAAEGAAEEDSAGEGAQGGEDEGEGGSDEAAEQEAAKWRERAGEVEGEMVVLKAELAQLRLERDERREAVTAATAASVAPAVTGDASSSALQQQVRDALAENARLTAALEEQHREVKRLRTAGGGAAAAAATVAVTAATLDETPEAAATREEAEAAVAAHATSVAGKRSELEEARAAEAELGAKRKELNSSYKRTVKALKETLEAKGFMKDGRKPKKSDLDDETKQAYKEKGDLKAELESVDQQYKEAHARMRALEAELAETEAAAPPPAPERPVTPPAATAAVPEGSAPASAEAAAEIARLREELRERVARHEEELAGAEEELAKARAAAGEAADAADAAPSAEAAALQARVAELEAQLDASMAAAAAAPAEEAAAAVKAVADSTPEELAARAAKAESKSASLKSKLKISISNTDKLKSKLDEVKAAYKKGREELKTLRADLETSRGEVRALEKKASKGGVGAAAAGAAGGSAEVKALKKQLLEERRAHKKELAAGGGGGGGAAAAAAAERELKDVERRLKGEAAAAQKDIKKQLADATKKATKYESAYNDKKQALAATEQKLAELEKEHAKLQRESAASADALGNMKEKLAEGAAAKARVEELIAGQAAMEATLDKARADLKVEQVLRKALRNELEDMKGKIRVYCRARPMNGREKSLGVGECLRFPDQYTVNLRKEEKDLGGSVKAVEKSYEFDCVFDPAVNGSQEDVFEECRGLAHSACDGFNVCIFAYGQTGSGKTFTMSGVPELPGLKPRFIHEMYDIADKTKEQYEYKFSCYLIEIYLDQLRDLFWLSTEGKKQGATMPQLAPVMDKKTGIVFVRNAIERTFTDAETMLRECDEAEKSRKVGATKMNAGSSRSHLIMAIRVERTSRNPADKGKKWIGKLSLIDLAGSESVGKTGAEKERLKEAQSINRSLSALSNVISTLAKGDTKHVSYRSNKLTALMQDSLGGNAKTLMFINISPSLSEFAESAGSLKWAQLVKTITNNASADTETKEIQRLKAIIKKLKAGGQAGGGAGGDDDDLEEVDADEVDENDTADYEAVGTE